MAVGDPVHIVAPTIVRFTYHMSVAGARPAACIMDLSLDEVGVSREDAVGVLATKVNSPWQVRIVEFMANNVSFLGSSFIDLDRLDGVTGFTAPNPGDPVAGADSNAQASPQVCYLVKKNTTARRGERPGRLYIPGVTEATVGEDGVVDSAKATTINARFASYKSDIIALGGLPAIGASIAPRVVHVHKHDSDDPDDWDWNSTDVTTFTCDTLVATQRRRLRG